MTVYCILDATHYPIEIYRNIDKAHRALEARNRGLVDNLCYLVRSRVSDLEPQGDKQWKEQA